MNTNKPIMILGTVMLVAGTLAFMPQAIAGGDSGVQVACKTITLDHNGYEKTVVFKVKSDTIIQEVWMDNSLTECISGEIEDDGTCVDSDFRIVALDIMGSVFRRNAFPICVAKKDKVSIWSFMRQGFDPQTYSAWPVDAGETLKVTLDAKPCDPDNVDEWVTDNDRKIKLCFGFLGKHDAKLYLED